MTDPDYWGAPHTVCEVDVPGRSVWGPGFYLVSADAARVEAGPFASPEAAERAARWLDDTARGVYPGPWLILCSHRALVVGARVRRLAERRLRQAGVVC